MPYNFTVLRIQLVCLPWEEYRNTSSELFHSDLFEFQGVISPRFVGFVPISRYWGTSFWIGTEQLRGDSVWLAKSVFYVKFSYSPSSFSSQSNQGVCLSEDPVYMTESRSFCSSDCGCHPILGHKEHTPSKLGCRKEYLYWRPSCNSSISTGLTLLSPSSAEQHFTGKLQFVE